MKATRGKNEAINTCSPARIFNRRWLDNGPKGSAHRRIALRAAGEWQRCIALKLRGWRNPAIEQPRLVQDIAVKPGSYVANRRQIWIA